MEIELKYRIPNEKIAEEIWQDKLFTSMEEKDSREEVCLDAKYFDTFNCTLAKAVSYTHLRAHETVTVRAKVLFIREMK